MGQITVGIGRVDKAPNRHHSVGSPMGQEVAQLYRILKFPVGSFGLDSILLIRSSILDPW
jgi:hypothetical protein